MDLHPQEAVEQTLLEHRDTLAVVGRDLDAALQSVAARFDDLYPDLRRMPSSALAANLRVVFGATTRLRASDSSTLRFVEGPSGNDSIHLYDAEKRRLRIRKYPLSVKVPGVLLPVSPPPETLFGPDLFVLPYEVAILWEPDYKSKALRQAVIAAVEGLDDWQNTVIYYQAPLPVAPVSPPVSSSEEDWDAEEFSEESGGEEEQLGPS